MESINNIIIELIIYEAISHTTNPYLFIFNEAISSITISIVEAVFDSIQ